MLPPLKPATRPDKRGFTLIELSIVLVIIGLIIGGVLVGQELINTASLRATVSQMERYSAAVNTFRIKYDFLPGDAPAAKMDVYGMPYAAAAILSDRRNDNGLINEVDFSITGYRGMHIESADVFPLLAFAGLVDGNFVSIGGSGSATSCMAGFAPIAYPVLKNKTDTGMVLIASSGSHYWHTGITRTANATCSGTIYSERYSFRPADAFYIASKLGDGKPYNSVSRKIQVVGINFYSPTSTIGYSGFVQPVDYAGTALYGAAGSANAVCYDNTTSSFNVAYTGYVCNLMVPAGF